MKPLHYVGLLILLIACFVVFIKHSAKEDGMNIQSFFGGKEKAEIKTSVGPEVGAELIKQSSMIEDISDPATIKSEFQGEFAEYAGEPPEGLWVNDKIDGETQHVFRIPESAGHPPLAIMNYNQQLELWELSSDKFPKFLKKRITQIDPEQSKWTFHYPLAVWNLPGNQVAVAVGYHNPAPKEALYIYNPETNQFRKVSDIEFDYKMGPPFSSFEILPINSDATILRYRTGIIRKSADNYCYEYNHLLLFSKRYPEGLEILNLSIDDGNIEKWGIKDNVLWLQTNDSRKPKEFVWSLNLSKTLSL